jgi:hypothetical protein
MFKPPPAPPNDTHVLVEQYWVECGDAARGDPEASGRYVVTPGTRRRLGALARAATLRRHPILLQGPTSSGKTSLVEYLAEKTGHRFVRINNHEHTDLQEYLGSYVTDENGACFDEKNAPRRKHPHERRDVFFPSFSSREPSLPRGRSRAPSIFSPRPASVRYSYAPTPWAVIELEGRRRGNLDADTARRAEPGRRRRKTRRRVAPRVSAIAHTFLYRDANRNGWLFFFPFSSAGDGERIFRDVHRLEPAV